MGTGAHNIQEKYHEIALFLTLKVLLDAAYVFFINPVYAYSGFGVDLNVLKLVESYALLVVLCLSLRSARNKRVSDLGVRVILLFIFTPLLSYYAMSNEPRAFVYLCVSGFLITVLTIRVVPSLGQRPMGRYRPIVVFLMGVVSAAILGLLLLRTGVPSMNALGFGPEIYEIRASANWGGTLLGYLIPWEARVLNCFLGAIAWTKRSKMMLAAVVISILVLFLITAHKSYLFAPVLVVCLVIALRLRRPFTFVLWTSIGVVVLSLLIQALGISTLPASIAVRRTLFVPAQITNQYYDFFSGNPKAYLSQSRLGFIFGEENPYKEYKSIAYMMGAIYAGNPDNHRNTGYLGSAFMNFGWIGIPITSILLGGLLVLMDCLTGHGEAVEEKALLLSLLMSLVNAGLLVAMLTHGLGLGIIVVWGYRRRIIAVAEVR